MNFNNCSMDDNDSNENINNDNNIKEQVYIQLNKEITPELTHILSENYLSKLQVLNYSPKTDLNNFLNGNILGPYPLVRTNVYNKKHKSQNNIKIMFDTEKNLNIIHRYNISYIQVYTKLLSDL